MVDRTWLGNWTTVARIGRGGDCILFREVCLFRSRVLPRCSLLFHFAGLGVKADDVCQQRIVVGLVSLWIFSFSDVMVSMTTTLILAWLRSLTLVVRREDNLSH